MKIMAIDYGDARTGFAISDRSEFLASPIGTVSERNAERLADKAAQTAATSPASSLMRTRCSKSWLSFPKCR